MMAAARPTTSGRDLSRHRNGGKESEIKENIGDDENPDGQCQENRADPEAAGGIVIDTFHPVPISFQLIFIPRIVDLAGLQGLEHAIQ